MSNKNIIIWVVVVLIILGLGWFYWVSNPSAYMPSAEQNIQTKIPATQQVVVSIGSNAKYPGFFVGAEGMTLYFKNGELNSSSCYDQCALNWPPLLASGELVGMNGVQTSALGTTDRTDGKKQVTYNGKPLYYWIKDKSRGDITGDGVGGIWSVATP